MSESRHLASDGHCGWRAAVVRLELLTGKAVAHLSRRNGFRLHRAASTRKDSLRRGARALGVLRVFSHALGQGGVHLLSGARWGGGGTGPAL